MSEKQQAKAERIQMDASDFAPRNDTAVYWLGNGGAMINCRGTIILIDPLLKGFDMPVMTEAPFQPEDVPHADAVLITHCDNDHFSRASLKELKDKTDRFCTTKYVAELFKELDIEAEGYDITDTFQIGPVRVTLTPAWHNWQNESPKHSKERYFKKEDYCGFYMDTPDGTVWMVGDSRLIEEQLQLREPDVILMDISDGTWHIGLHGVKILTDKYPNSQLIPIHWGCVRSNWKEFNGDPAVLKDFVKNPERIHVLPVGGHLDIKK